MYATITVEFFSDTKEHLKILEQQLKHEHDVDVDLVEPKDVTAPALVAIGIKKSGERAEKAVQEVARVLYNFLHNEAGAAGQKRIFLLTIEGDRVDIEPLSVEEIEGIILAAKEGENI
ncbi:MAG TPA: hypothetical protein VKR83_17240 [Ktedonobacteraceae bacterium]|nr:hypothetical protein [Ktedonobacteraceae bacterium]